MTSKISGSQLSQKQTAAQLLAAAVYDLYPGALLAGGEGTSHYFYYDFELPFVFQDPFLPLIEERMKAILRERRSIRKLEMMPANAAELFESRGQSVVTERLLSTSTATVSICQIGEMYDFCPFDFLEDFGQPYWKLIEAYDPQISGKSRVRIVGVLATNKTELKAMGKRPFPSIQSHVRSIKERKFFHPLSKPGFWMWLPDAEWIRSTLSALWHALCAKDKIDVISTPYSFFEGLEEELEKAHLSQNCYQKTGELCSVFQEEEGGGEGLFLTPASFTDRAYVVCAREKLLEETISSLQSILKILKILHFEFDVVLSVSRVGNQKERRQAVQIFEQALKQLGLSYEIRSSYRRFEHARIEMQIADSLGRKWSGSFLSFSLKEGCLVRSLFGSMERLVALLIEQSGGQFPLWLAREQIRILPVNGKALSYAQSVCNQIETAGIRARIVQEPEPLKVRMYDARKECVPCVIFVGGLEERAQSLTVRMGQESEERQMSLEELIAIMQRCETDWKRLI